MTKDCMPRLIQKLKSKINYLDLVCNGRENGKLLDRLRSLSKADKIDQAIIYDAIKRIEHQASIINVVKDVLNCDHQNE